MQRKAVTRCLSSIVRIRSLLGSARAALARQLGERAAAVAAAPAGREPIYDPVFDHLDAELATAHRELAEAESDYGNAQPMLAHLRSERDVVARILHDMVAPIPRLLRGLPELAGTGIPAVMPASPEALAQQLPDTLDFLGRLAANPPSPVVGVRIDAVALAAEVEGGLRRLEACLSGIVKAEADLTYARARANEAFDRARQVAQWVGRTVRNLTGLAGEEGVGRRMGKGGG